MADGIDERDPEKERLKRVTDRVRKHLTGIMLTPKDMNAHDVEDQETAQGKRDVLEPSETGSTRGAGHAELQEPVHHAQLDDSAAADVSSGSGPEPVDASAADNDQDVHMDKQVHISPISKSKHFRSIVDAYRKNK